MSNEPTPPKNLREQYRQAKENLSEEDAAKFKKQQRLIFAIFGVLAIVTLIFGFFSGRAISEKRSHTNSAVSYSQNWEVV
ncbi:hypothetical protein ACFPGO_01355 [Arcanobacterium canis]|uniref:Uncharacterized protein n=1 Tax=Arcanobacterium canis TaxID=999183 RepID=A0ABY8FW81_9ACTO|nr:hypothetical protein [Arcanobacterium canis]WFM82774.1 hypothetical protein P7079_05035 [Arcanobacterium canis]